MEEIHARIDKVNAEVGLLGEKITRFESIERRVSTLEGNVLWMPEAIRNLQLAQQSTTEKLNNMCFQVSKTENHLSAAIKQNTDDIKELNDNFKELSKDIKALLEFKATEKGKSEAYWKIPVAIGAFGVIIGIIVKFWNHFK